MKKYPEPRVVSIRSAPADGTPLFLAAKLAAEAAASAIDVGSAPAMLVSWKDNLTGESSPHVEACGDCGLEGWEMYAASRGADLRVEVNGGEYVFMFVHFA
ncbi:MAG: AF1514 family protein [Nitrospirae bacterium]|nr:AF1514 family protein [Nitrospirota bacterium]